jgi:nucleotide-binding universal stress UspA family protein
MPAAPFRRIAVATDGSETADAALEVAIDLAKRYSADLLVLAVAPLPPVFATPNSPIVPATIPESPLPMFREVVDRSIAQARSAGLAGVSGVCEEGVIVDRLLEQVRDHGSDLLVVGSRGLSTAQRLLLGSVSTALVTHAPCPVLVVRPPAKPKPRSPNRARSR